MIGLDTETLNGRAVLICSSDGRTCWPRSLDQILQFLMRLPADAVGWNSSYDARAIIAWAPRDVQVRLAYLTMASYGGYQIRYIERKVFEIFRRRDKRRWALYDAMPFYGCSLQTASEKYLKLSKLKQDVTPEGINRALQTDAGRQKLRAYCVQDARLTLMLWERLEKSLNRLQISTDRPISPASVAAKYFHAGWPKEYRRESRLLARWGRAAYHGGRVEIWHRGYVPHAWEIDISSAYPSVLAKLPHPEAITWCQVQRPTPRAVMGIYRVRLEVAESLPAGPVPVVVSGVCTYPVGTWETWIDLYTYRLIQDVNGISIRMLNGIEAYWRGNPVYAYPQVRELYNLKEKSKEYRLAAKLMLNSLSGKLIQHDVIWREARAGEDYYIPPWAPELHLTLTRRVGPYYRPIAAAHVTGEIRARVWRAAIDHASHVISIMTDALWLSAPPQIKCDGGLGGWTIARANVPLVMVGCGIYCYRKDGAWHSAMRGLQAHSDLHQILTDAPRNATTVKVPVKMPTTLITGLKSGEINAIGTVTKVLDLNMDTKRQWDEPATARKLLEKVIDSRPHVWYQ